jgi:nicotinamidase-related amidase
VVVVEDGCATWTPEKHNAAINAMDETSAKIKTTAEMVRIIEALDPAPLAERENLLVGGL